MRKIVIIGPESTGKSVLSEQLAAYYQTIWCPEFARDYLLQLKRPYSYEDLLNIAHGQLSLEDTLLTKAKNGYYFIDTDMYVMKIWCEFVFGRCHQWILDKIAERKYTLYLLCDVDLPWQEDPLREYPDLESRLKLFHIYKDNMTNQHVPWKIISGSYDVRLKTAIDAVNRLLVYY